MTWNSTINFRDSNINNLINAMEYDSDGHPSIRVTSPTGFGGGGGGISDTVWIDSTSTYFVYHDTGSGTPLAYSIPGWAVYTPVAPIVQSASTLSNYAIESGGNLDSVRTNTSAISTATGTTSDTAWAGSGTSTIIAALRGIYTKLAGSIAVTQSGSNWAISSLPALPTGTNLIGKVGIDQTTPGTTNGVSITNSALPNLSTTDSGNITTIATAQGAAVTGQTLPTGYGVLGWLSYLASFIKQFTFTSANLNTYIAGKIATPTKLSDSGALQSSSANSGTIAASAYSTTSLVIDNTATGTNGSLLIDFSLSVTFASAFTGSLAIIAVNYDLSGNAPTAPTSSIIYPIYNMNPQFNAVAAGTYILTCSNIPQARTKTAYYIYNNGNSAISTGLTINARLRDVGN